jgi:hypothetical protein
VASRILSKLHLAALGLLLALAAVAVLLALGRGQGRGEAEEGATPAAGTPGAATATPTVGTPGPAGATPVPEALTAGGGCVFDDPPTTYEGSEDRSLYSNATELAAFNMLLPGDSYFGLPALEAGLRGSRTTSATANIPPVLLKSIAWIESAFTQASREVPFEAIGPALVSFDCGHGIMQVTSGMTSPLGERGCPSPQQALVVTHFAYNIARGAAILADKWNSAPESRPIAGIDTGGDPAVIENWYFAVWSYNGFTGPGANRSNHPMDPIYGAWPRVPYSCGPTSDGLGHNRGNYPFQELVFGCASHPPQVDGVNLWTPQPVDLPDLNDPRWREPLKLENFVYPYDKMDIPTPRQPAGGYQPAIPAVTLTPAATPTPYPPGYVSPTPTPLAHLPFTPTPSATSPSTPQGSYASSAIVGHRDLTQRPPATLRATMFGTPGLSVSTSAIRLSYSAETGAGSQTLTIKNTGTGILSWLAVPSAPWLVASPMAGVAVGPDLSCAASSPCERAATITISVDPTMLLPGTNTATVTILAPGINRSYAVAVTTVAVIRVGVPGVTHN